MKHPNRSMSIGKQTPNFISGEIVICVLLCIIGLLGLHRIMSAHPDHSPTVYSTPTNTSPKKSPSSHITTQVIEEPMVLRITGIYEAKEKLSIHIPDYHGKISYELEMGNGTILTPKNPTTTYAYPHQGKYDLKLWGTCNGKKKLLRTNTITIDKEIEVSKNAFVEVGI